MSSDSLVDVLLEFFEALVHQILFVRELYSPELFERQRLYGIAVRHSRHPDLNSYISEAVAGLKVGRCLFIPSHGTWLCLTQCTAALAANHAAGCSTHPSTAFCSRRPQASLATGSLVKLAVVVLGPDGAPVERFVVEQRVGCRVWSTVCACRVLSRVRYSHPSCFGPGAHRTWVHLPAQILVPGGASLQQEGLEVEAIEAQLRGVLLKLQYADSYLRKLPGGCRFEVVAYTSRRGGVPQEAWVEEQPAPGHLELRQARAEGCH